MNFIKRFFETNLNDYDNIGVNFPIGVFIFLFAVVFCICVFAIHFNKKRPVDTVAALIRHEAYDEGSAKSPQELSLSTFGLGAALTHGRLGEIVGIAGREELDYDKYMSLSKEEKRAYDRPDAKNIKIYVKQGRLSEAQDVYDKEGASIITPILTSFTMLVVLIIVARFLPDILTLINNSLK